MTCPACGAVPDGSVKFCLQCGTRLAVACATCGTPVVPGARFCGECGAEVTAALPATSAAADAPSSAAVAERRLVSVLFADLVGFTTLSEARDPEETRELLTEYFESARVVISRYGGTVEKFIGDAVMAVWGTPVAHEDDAERAVRSALDLVEAVAVLGEKAGAPGLRARAGVLTGEAAVTLGASDQGMVAGDLVNTAARLQSAAEPGAVFVGEATRHATANSIAYEDAGAHTMKGKAEPVPAFRAVRVLSERRGVGRTGHLEAPFTGRQSELRMLKDFLHAVGAERRPRVVSVMGQGGIGKSRLAWELLKYVDGLSEDIYWHHGRCPAYGDGVSFWALGEMVRARAQITERESPQTAGAKLSDMLAEFVPDEAERRWVEPALRRLLGLDGGDDRASGNPETYFAAWRTFFERIAARGTTALVFEDLQWADPGLLDFLEHLLEWSRGHPIYVVALTRPELVERRPGWGTGWRNFTSLNLEPLSDDAMRELLEGLVPGLPEDVSARIRERAEGVPLYAVETIRKLLADGRLEAEGSVFRPVGDLSVLAVPETLHALVASRLDALPAVDRSIVQEASVLGKTFTLGALADISAHPQESWERKLRELVRRELFVLDVDPRSPERGQYGFVQDLVREVAYGTLSRRDRRRIHLAAARHFEQHQDEEIAGVIASHYLEAYRAQPDGPDGETVAEAARAALWAAAERALRLGSHDGALSYFRQALEVARDDADRVELHLAAGRAATEVNRDADADAHVSGAIELARRRGDRLAELRAVTLQGLVRISLGHSDAAVEPLERAARDFEDHEATAEYVELTDALSRAYMRTGRHDDSLRWADRGLREAERREMSRVNLELLVTRATVLGVKGRLKEAVATLIGARALAASAGFVDIEARAVINLGFVWSNDDLRAGLQVSREGAETALRMGLRSFLAYMVGNGAECGFQVGEWDVVEDLLDRAIAVETEDAATGYLRGWRTRLAAARAQPYRADLDIFLSSTPQDDPQGRAAVADLEAFLALAEGRLTDARSTGAALDEPTVWTSAELLVPGRAAMWERDAGPLRGLAARLDGEPGRVVAAFRAELLAGA
ncbi:MAG TPA: adenylate/guanylate cyclase domain-containing protein, partial [Actinomycetes bacterium]|nr:adenylate/guanylate cyclase domain-containing protein [Actinomycetes bacterium]